GGGLRRGLTVFQFGISIFLIIGTAVIGRQVHYLQNKDLGYDKDRLLAVSLPDESSARIEVLKNALRREGAAARVTGTASNMANLNWSSGSASWPGKNPDLKVITYNNYVDEDFAETFGVSLRAGRFFSKDFPADREGYVVNESFERLLGEGSAVGKTLVYWKNPGPIIGVLKDFHFQTLQSQIQPLVLMLRPEQVNLCYLRIPEGGRPAALERIGAVWKEVMPEYPFQYRFVDEALDSYYQTVRRTGRLADTFAVLAVFIACLGLLSLASFMTERRAREISIRKVLGASVPSILVLLTREFTVGVLLANILAWPAAYLITNRWLSQFAYRAPVGAGVFALSAAAALVVALLAVGVQTLRAALSHPAKALRTE
ncbi:MAG: ABC transporter permease, partial [Candidatus Aminicenantes bacterium]|nr:ABC transporter permease [Candidatus Aminicenantes bacterium]